MMKQNWNVEKGGKLIDGLMRIEVEIGKERKWGFELRKRKRRRRRYGNCRTMTPTSKRRELGFCWGNK